MQAIAAENAKTLDIALSKIMNDSKAGGRGVGVMEWSEPEKARILASKARQEIERYQTEYGLSDPITSSSQLTRSNKTKDKIVQIVHKNGTLQKHDKPDDSGAEGEWGQDGSQGQHGQEAGEDGQDGGSGWEGGDGKDGNDADKFDVMIELQNHDVKANTRTYKVETVSAAGKSETDMITVPFPDGMILIDASGGKGGTPQ